MDEISSYFKTKRPNWAHCCLCVSFPILQPTHFSMQVWLAEDWQSTHVEWASWHRIKIILRPSSNKWLATVIPGHQRRIPSRACAAACLAIEYSSYMKCVILHLSFIVRTLSRSSKSWRWRWLINGTKKAWSILLNCIRIRRKMVQSKTNLLLIRRGS